MHSQLVMLQVLLEWITARVPSIAAHDAAL